MTKKINNILIGLLWLLAIALGASFWFNTKYGFNIFSIQHWQYLAYMQATGQPVRASFYISLLFIVVLATFGLYRLLQPRFRRIVMPIIDHHQQASNPPQPVVAAAPQSVSEEHTEPVVNVAPEQNQAKIVHQESTRPPRLNIPNAKHTTAPVPRVPLMSTAPAQHITPEQEYADIREIFTSNGFVYKGSPQIKGMQTSIIAIGSNEVLWIGATGVSTSDMQRAVDTLNGVFSDTLDDIEIHVNAFIIGATDDAQDASIIHFASVDDLREYIDTHPNTPPEEDEIENFDAYSGYIGTVIDYIGKI